jgi:hypothetical protein
MMYRRDRSYMRRIRRHISKRYIGYLYQNKKEEEVQAITNDREGIVDWLYTDVKNTADRRKSTSRKECVRGHGPRHAAWGGARDPRTPHSLFKWFLRIGRRIFQAVHLYQKLCLCVVCVGWVFFIQKYYSIYSLRGLRMAWGIEIDLL